MFTSIALSLIAVGKALTRNLFLLIKNNLDNHESRLNVIETTSKKVPIFQFTLYNGSVFSTATGLAYFKSNDTFTVTNADIQIYEVNGLTGPVEIDIKRSVTDLNGTSFLSIFTTKPSVNFTTASNYDVSVNQVFDPARVALTPGDFLRLDITQSPTNGVLPKIIINVYGE